MNTKLNSKHKVQSSNFVELSVFHVENNTGTVGCSLHPQIVSHQNNNSSLFLSKSILMIFTLVINDSSDNRKNDLILIMTPEKQDKTSELSKHWSADSTPARNEVILKRTHPVKSVKCDKICSNY